MSVFIKPEEEKTRSIVLSSPCLLNVMLSGGKSRVRLCSSWRDKNQLGSTMGCSSGASPFGVVDVEVPKYYMVDSGIRNCSRNEGKNYMGVK